MMGGGTMTSTETLMENVQCLLRSHYDSIVAYLQHEILSRDTTIDELRTKVAQLEDDAKDWNDVSMIRRQDRIIADLRKQVEQLTAKQSKSTVVKEEKYDAEDEDEDDEEQHDTASSPSESSDEDTVTDEEENTYIIMDPAYQSEDCSVDQLPSKFFIQHFRTNEMCFVRKNKKKDVFVVYHWDESTNKKAHSIGTWDHDNRTVVMTQ